MTTDAKEPDPDEPIAFIETSMGEVAQVSTALFLSKVLPQVHPGLQDINARIELGCFKGVMNMQEKMWGYTKKPPSGVHSSDWSCAYAPLMAVIRVILADTNPKARLDPLHLEPSKTGDDTKLGKPHAVFVWKNEADDALQWNNMVSGVYRIHESDDAVKENIEKILRCMREVMRRDPRRRFTYGYTIEDTRMTLWYYDRKQILCSRPFDFLKDIRMLIQFVLSLASATEADFGVDPTMTLVPGKDLHYDIEVHDTAGGAAIYRTLELMSNDEDEALGLNKGTRMWAAVRLVNGEPTGKPVALKDTWVSGAREREGDVHARFMRSEYMTAHPELQRHFIMVQAHGNVVALGGVLDRTPDFLMCGREDDTEHGKLDFKVHYRIVYEEIGTPLVWAEPLRNIFGALKQAIDGVAAMHRAGWLHRDLNPWSILVVNKVAKVTDLGYAVAASEQTRYEDVGTALFRSTEVDHGCYRCQLEPSASRARIRRRLKPTKAGSDPKATHPDSKTGTGTITPSDLDLQNGSDAPSDSEVHISSDEWRFVNDPRDEWAFELVHEPGTLPPPENLITEGSNETRSGFCYNSLHDLESLWWIAVYFAVWAGANDCGPPHLPHEFRERKQQRRTDVVQVRQDESKNAVASEVDKSSTTAISANPTEAAPPASVQNTASHPPATTSTARGSSNAPLTLSRPRHPALAYFHSERGSARSDVWTKSNAFMRQMHGLLPRLALEPVVALLEGARVSLCAAHERASRERLGYVLRSREPESEIEEHRRIRIFFSAAQAALLDRKLMLPKLGLGWM